MMVYVMHLKCLDVQILQHVTSDASATEENNSCTYPEGIYDCDGVTCINDADGDGVCDELETSGCTDSTACNYNSSATDDDGTCDYAATNFDCDGNCLVDIDCEGTCGGSVVEDACGVCNGDNSTCSPAPLFYSEYAEGSSNNKYFEIYNPTDESVDLTYYNFVNCSNGCDDWEYFTALLKEHQLPLVEAYLLSLSFSPMIILHLLMKPVPLIMEMIIKV